MSHILRAHQLCMEGYSSLFDKHLSTVWSAPNYCYRCGNSASILEVGLGGSMYFNVFDAAPENERDGPSQQAAQNAGGKVCFLILCFQCLTQSFYSYLSTFYSSTSLRRSRRLHNVHTYSGGRPASIIMIFSNRSGSRMSLPSFRTNFDSGREKEIRIMRSHENTLFNIRVMTFRIAFDAPGDRHTSLTVCTTMTMPSKDVMYRRHRRQRRTVKVRKRSLFLRLP